MVALLAGTDEPVRAPRRGGTAGRDIGWRVRQQRRARDWTQGHLAVRSGAGVDRGFISALERGAIADPGADKLHRIASALGVTLDYLIVGMDPTEGVSVRVPAALVPRVRRLARLPGDTAAAFLDSVEQFFARTHLREEPAEDEADWPDDEPDERVARGDHAEA